MQMISTLGRVVNTGFDWVAKGGNLAFKTQIPWLVAEAASLYVMTSVRLDTNFESEVNAYQEVSSTTQKEWGNRLRPYEITPLLFLAIYGALTTLVATRGLRELPGWKFLAYLPMTLGLKYADVMVFTRVWPTKVKGRPSAFNTKAKYVYPLVDAAASPLFAAFCGYFALRGGEMFFRGFTAPNALPFAPVVSKLISWARLPFNR